MEIDKIIRKKVKNQNENQKFYSALFLKKNKNEYKFSKSDKQTYPNSNLKSKSNT